MLQQRKDQLVWSWQRRSVAEHGRHDADALGPPHASLQAGACTCPFVVLPRAPNSIVNFQAEKWVSPSKMLAGQPHESRFSMLNL